MSIFREVNGGEGGIRTHGTVARTTVFETVPFNHSGTSPRHTSNVVSSGAEHRQGFRPPQEAISAFAGFFAMHSRDRQKALSGKGLRVFSGAAGFTCVSFFRSATRPPVMSRPFPGQCRHTPGLHRHVCRSKLHDFRGYWIPTFVGMTAPPLASRHARQQRRLNTHVAPPADATCRGRTRPGADCTEPAHEAPSRTKRSGDPGTTRAQSGRWSFRRQPVAKAQDDGAPLRASGPGSKAGVTQCLRAALRLTAREKLPRHACPPLPGAEKWRFAAGCGLTFLWSRRYTAYAQ